MVVRQKKPAAYVNNDKLFSLSIDNRPVNTSHKSAIINGSESSGTDKHYI